MKYILILIFSFSALSYVDLSLQYSASKRESILDPNIDGGITSETQTFSVGWAWYIWEYTALELNYSKSKYTQTNTREQVIEPTVTITKTVSITETEVKGAGLRFSLAKRKSFLIPTIAVGYALLTTNGNNITNFEVSGTPGEYPDELDEQESSSSYISAGLKVNITKLVGLQLNAKSVMEDFKLAEADKNITYLAGFSWVF
jgi:hypothetical protein